MRAALTAAIATNWRRVDTQVARDRASQVAERGVGDDHEARRRATTADGARLDARSTWAKMIADQRRPAATFSSSSRSSRAARLSRRDAAELRRPASAGIGSAASRAGDRPGAAGVVNTHQRRPRMRATTASDERHEHPRPAGAPRPTRRWPGRRRWSP